MRKKQLLLIGFLPPPVTGLSMAFNLLVTASQHVFDLCILNLSTRDKQRQNGLLSFTRIIEILASILMALWFLITRPRISVVYLTMAQTPLGFFRDFLLIKLSSLFGKKIILHLHGGYFAQMYDQASPRLKNMIYSTLLQVDQVIVLGASLKKCFAFMGDGFASRIRVVPNAIDTHLIPSAPLRRRLQADRPVRLLFLSNLMTEKGYDDVLQAIAQLSAKHLRIEGHFCGKFILDENRFDSIETMQAAFYATLDNLNIRQCIHWHGLLSGQDKMRMLMDSDIFLLPTWYKMEGQPIAILEAMAYGLPVISTDHSGIPDIVSHERNGLLVQPQSPALIVSAVERLLLDPDLYASISTNNYADAQEKYYPQIHIDRIHQILTGV